MTFDAFETTREGSRPVELYLFELLGTQYAFSSGEDSITSDAVVYTPEPITRSNIVSSFERKDNQLTVTVPANNEFGRLFIDVIPGERATLDIRQIQRADTSTPQSVLLYEGRVSTVGFARDLKEIKIVTRPIVSAGERPAPRITYQGLCNHMLFDDRCGLIEASFTEALSVVSVSGRNVQLSGTVVRPDTPVTALQAGSDWFEAGFIKFGNEYRLITKQLADGVTMRVNLPFRTSPLNETVSVVPGCKHRLTEDCFTKFSNNLNYGGFPFVPTKNPFNTGLD